MILVKTIKKKSSQLSQIKWKSSITTRLVTGISGWKKLCFAPWDRGDIPQDPNRHGGTGLLSGGRPQRGHIVECSSSRVTYCYTVLSPVKSIYTHAQKHASDIWTNRMNVRKDWKRRQESKKAAQCTWVHAETWLFGFGLYLPHAGIFWFPLLRATNTLAVFSQILFYSLESRHC